MSNVNREDILKTLRVCAERPCGTECPHYNEKDCLNYLLEGCLKLLNDTPRVMTAEEVKELAQACGKPENIRAVWIESGTDLDLGTVEQRPYMNANEFICFYVGSGTPETVSFKNYGRTWRCWMNWPNEEEREAAKWIDETEE